jgi:ABC-2 type transport system permease protein
VSALEPSTPVVLGRTVRAEWARLWTVRSTWLFVLVATLGVVGISLLVGVDSRGEGQTEPGETVWIAVQTLGMIALLLLLAMATVSTTADHGTGGILPTLQCTPRRGLLLAARSTVIVATDAVVGLLLALLAAVLINRIAPVLALTWDEGVDTLSALGFVYALGMLLAVGLGMLLRSTAGAVVTVLGLMLVLPLVLGNLPFGWAKDLAVLLPGSSALRLVVDAGPAGLTTTDARITLAAWAVAALAVGGWRLVRTDANR